MVLGSTPTRFAKVPLNLLAFLPGDTRSGRTNGWFCAQVAPKLWWWAMSIDLENLTGLVHLFAMQLRKEFALEIGRDLPTFKRAVVRLLRAEFSSGREARANRP
jgi:hypothetical protein